MRSSPRAGRLVAIGFGVGFRFQFASLRTQADIYYAFVSAPIFAVIFMSIAVFTGREFLTASALVAPVLMTMWTMALMFSGEMISEDRENGRMEALLATPVSFPLLLLGRLLTCMVLSLPAFVLSVLVSGLVFGHWITIHHPVLFTVTILLTALATAATATALSAVFVTAPGARIVQNSLSFPIFLLGGVVVPASFFPAWLEPVSRLVYLSWSADLLRAAQAPEPVAAAPVYLFMVVLLGGVGLAVGSAFINVFLRRARALGNLTHV